MDAKARYKILLAQRNERDKRANDYAHEDLTGFGQDKDFCDCDLPPWLICLKHQCECEKL